MTPTVVIIGGGPSGLTAAAALAPVIEGEVLVLEREGELGGIPRHSHHLGYGVRDLRRVLSGPEYARRLTDRARAAGAKLETQAMATGWPSGRTLEVTSPRGRRLVEADAVILATGARERPRPARMIAGDRPDGVHTTGELQNLVHLHGARVGTRAVIVGAELVSWSAVLTLRSAGCAVAALVTSHARSEAYAGLALTGRALLGAPLLTHSRVARINGRERVESVEVVHVVSGERRTIECDTVIVTGDWIPDHELAVAARVVLDPATRGPWVDDSLATSAGGVFAVGNLVHPVDTADGAALDGRHVVASVQDWLSSSGPGGRSWSAADRLALTVEAPLRWVTPQSVSAAGGAPRGLLTLWSDAHRAFPVLEATQGGRVVGRLRTPWAMSPGRVFRLPERILRAAHPDAGPVALRLAP